MQATGASVQIFFSLAIFLFITFPVRAEVTGMAQVIDGNTIWIGDNKIILWGYDAPEPDQTCSIKGKFWPCGQAATDHLKEFINGKMVSCIAKGRNAAGLMLSKCSIGTLDLGAEMVEVGLAIPFWENGGRYYIQSFKEARGVGRGMHAGSFVNPWEWQRQ